MFPCKYCTPCTSTHAMLERKFSPNIFKIFFLKINPHPNPSAITADINSIKELSSLAFFYWCSFKTTPDSSELSIVFKVFIKPFKFRSYDGLSCCNIFFLFSQPTYIEFQIMDSQTSFFPSICLQVTRLVVLKAEDEDPFDVILLFHLC